MTTPSDLVDRAFALAEAAHYGQTRRGGAPYITHIREVMRRAPKDPVSQAVAADHDVLEDTPLTADDLRAAGLPEEVIRGVQVLTRNEGESYEAFIERVQYADGGRWVPIKMADLLANLSDSPTPRQIYRYAAALLVLVEP